MKHILLLTTALLGGCTNATPLTSTSWLASAAIAAVVSALVAGVVSIYIKHKEYENEYFKKVIEKRLKGIESIEDATAPFRLRYLSTNSDGTKSTYQPFFISLENKEIFKEAVAETSKHVVWHSTPTAKAFGAFAEKVSAVLVQCKTLDEAERKKLAITEFRAIDKEMAKLHQSINEDMLKLHKVKAFLRSKIREFK